MIELAFRQVAPLDDASKRSPHETSPYPKRDGAHCSLGAGIFGGHGAVGRHRAIVESPTSAGPVCEKCAAGWLRDGLAVLQNPGDLEWFLAQAQRWSGPPSEVNIELWRDLLAGHRERGARTIEPVARALELAAESDRPERDRLITALRSLLG